VQQTVWGRQRSRQQHQQPRLLLSLRKLQGCRVVCMLSEVLASSAGLILLAALNQAVMKSCSGMYMCSWVAASTGPVQTNSFECRCVVDSKGVPFWGLLVCHRKIQRC
jgi:hypothetical protein